MLRKQRTRFLSNILAGTAVVFGTDTCTLIAIDYGVDASQEIDFYLDGILLSYGVSDDFYFDKDTGQVVFNFRVKRDSLFTVVHVNPMQA